MSDEGDRALQNEAPKRRKDRPWLLPTNRRLRNLQGISIRNLLVTPPTPNRNRGKTIDDDSIPNTLQTKAKMLANQEIRTMHHSRSATELNRVARAPEIKTPKIKDGKQTRMQEATNRRRGTILWSEVNPETRQTGLEDIASSRMADTCFSIHCTGIEGPVYVSEVVERAMNPNFRTFDLKNRGPAVSRMDHAIIRIWAKPVTAKECFLLVELTVQFRALQYIGKSLENFRHPFPTNCVIFHFVDGVYTSLTEISAAAEPTRYHPREMAGSSRTEASNVASSDTLRRLVNLDECLQDALATRDKVEAQITSILVKNNDNLSIPNQQAQLEERLAAARKSVAMERKRLQQSQKRKAGLIASIQARKAAMQQARENQEKASTYLQEAQTTKESSEKLLKQTLDDSEGQIRRICEDLNSIFPIEPIPGKPLAFTIIGIPLPNSNFENIDKDSVAAALGYTAHLVYLLSFYLSVPLPYPIQAYASHSFIKDPISAGLSQRVFPLYPVNAQYRFEYGVFLLNKDIEYLLNRRGSRVLDIRHTLPNLKYLLYLLTASTGELPARKAGGVRGLFTGATLIPNLSRRESTESVASGQTVLNQKKVGHGSPAILINGEEPRKSRSHFSKNDDLPSKTTVAKATAAPGPSDNQEGRNERIAFRPGKVQ